MNGELCSKCRTAESLSYHRYCKTCHRIAAGRTLIPKFTRDPNNKTMCSKCRVNPRQENHRYCRACANKARKDWIKSKGGKSKAFTLEQQHKLKVRRYFTTQIQRGKIKRTPCAVCGDPNAQNHHNDYVNQTTNVTFLCFKHHREAHKNEDPNKPAQPKIEWTPDPRRRPVLERIADKSIVADDGCFLWQGYIEHGHGKISDGGKMNWIHRLAWELFNGPIPADKWVLHKCVGHANCWNPNHLYLGDSLQNNKDRCEQGRNGNINGAKNGRAILTIEQVAWIRKHYEPGSRKGMSTVRMAKILGVSQAAVYCVVKNITWKNPIDSTATVL